MERYKYRSYESSNDCFVYSYNMPAEINIKEKITTKRKRRHLNRFLRKNQNKTTSTNGKEKSKSLSNLNNVNNSSNICISKKNNNNNTGVRKIFTINSKKLVANNASNSKKTESKPKKLNNLNCCKIS